MEILAIRPCLFDEELLTAYFDANKIINLTN